MVTIKTNRAGQDTNVFILSHHRGKNFSPNTNKCAPRPSLLCTFIAALRSARTLSRSSFLFLSLPLSSASRPEQLRPPRRPTNLAAVATSHLGVELRYCLGCCPLVLLCHLGGVLTDRLCGRCRPLVGGVVSSPTHCGRGEEIGGCWWLWLLWWFNRRLDSVSELRLR